MTADCEWYKLCTNGKFENRKCPLSRRFQKQMFDPTTKNCTEHAKLPVDGKCGSYKECSIKDWASVNGKWTEVACGSGQHFDQKSQKCIKAEASTCSKCFPSVCKKIFQVNFSKTNTILCVRTESV